MRRRDIINEIKLCLIGAGLGAAVFGSFLFFGCRAKAASVRDGVHSPVYAALQTMDRDELADMRAREEYEEPVLAAENETPVASVGYSGSDLDLLAALVWAEAGDQPIPEGLCYVCDVVLNRVDSPAWPNTIADVIYQPGQFSVVNNGALNRAFGNVPQVCYDAVQSQLSGRLNYDIIYFSMGYNANGTLAFTHGTHFYSY